jgi:hypothetical protein
MRSPSGRRDGTIRRQARFLGKPVRAPLARNPGRNLRKSPETDQIPKQMHGMNAPGGN